ncbi:MAG: hypothetical protein JF609_09720, partial [Verrucomicrobia bacterium]|nr:hypothetical protein [Verrucomicrobiota bacterium]
PQLYWDISPPATSFSTLMDWWNSANVKHRHIWPGMDSLKAADKWPASEIVNQIGVTRRYPNPGHIHWSAMALMKNAALDTALARDVYTKPALIPASPWLNATSPPPPKLSVSTWRKSVHVEWKNAAIDPARLWVLQCYADGNWTTQIIPGPRLDAYLDNINPAAIALRAVGRTGNLSEPVLWTPKKYSPPDSPKGPRR